MTSTTALLREVGLSTRDIEIIGDLFAAGGGYYSYLARKRHGTRRIFVAWVEVSSNLKLLHQALELAQVYSAPDCVQGYVRGRGIKSNASQHLDKDVVLCVDLKDFFPSVTAAMIENELLSLGLDGAGALEIARATTIDGVLPAGLSTSPWLSNLVFRSTDIALLELADTFKVSYTRFADDMTFSGTFSDEVLAEVDSTLTRQGWELNRRKTRFMRRGGPQYVTGLYVGDPDQPRIPRRIKRRLRQRLYYLSKYGYVNVIQRGYGEAMFQNQADGWIRYVRSVEPRVAASLEGMLKPVDFSGDDEYPYWDDPDSWMDILDDAGYP